MRTRVQPVTVQDKQIGPGAPCYIIAEAGVNHNGDLHMAHKLVDAAADCGADAVKFQTFSAEKLVTSFAPKAAYQEAGTKAGESQLDMLKQSMIKNPQCNVFLGFNRSLSENFIEARDKILKNLKNLNWSDGFYRKDIGHKVIN